MFGGSGVSESRFYMWRAVFALAHADEAVAMTERIFMFDALKKEKFSREQRDILEEDMDDPKDPLAMFSKISEQEDRTRFFYYARMLCWCDGDFDAQEQEIVARLQRRHIEDIDVDQLIESLDLTLEDDHKETIFEDMKEAVSDGILGRFIRRFWPG